MIKYIIDNNILSIIFLNNSIVYQ